MSTQIYIGELTRSVSPRYLEKEFAKFGKITNFSFKGRFAFVDYEDAKDAEVSDFIIPASSAVLLARGSRNSLRRKEALG